MPVWDECEGVVVTGYRVSPQGVDQTLGRVRSEADGLSRALESVWSDAPSASGGSEVVADALGGFVQAAQDDMRAVADRLESAPGAMVRAVAAILEGDEEMARTHTNGLSVAESVLSSPFGPPSGVQGLPVPEQSGAFGAFDPSRFGGPPVQSSPESSLQSGESSLAFDPERFGAAKPVRGSGS